MVELSVVHSTRYVYRKAIAVGPHRLMLRPREGRTLQVTEFGLHCQPSAKIDWTQDVFGNGIALASFETPTNALTIESRTRLRHSEPAWPVFPISASATTFPFSYSPEENIDLGALRSADMVEGDGSLSAWIRGFVAFDATDTLSLLKDINAGLSAAVVYESREEYGTQSASETLKRGRGSCRDIATLFIEAVRSLGLGARAVSGYLWDPMHGQVGSAGTGSTHAWADVFIPGAGWIAFDPTNGRVGSGHLVPVAVARSIQQIAPVTGGFQGDPEDSVAMSVSVEVTELSVSRLGEGHASAVKAQS